MELWLLNGLDTAALSLVVVGGIVLLAVAGALLTRRRFPQTVHGEHNEMVGVVLGMFGAIYGIILAFVIVTLWTQLETTNSIVASESTAAASLVRNVRALPPQEQDRVNAAMSGYLHAVVDVQWPLMREGEPNYESTARSLDAVYDALQSYEPQTETQQTFYELAAGNLNEVVAQRRARITMATQQLPLLLQVLVFGGALVIIPLTFLYGVRSRRMQLLFVGTVAALVGFSLLLTLVLDRPFSGELSVSPAPYKEGALAQFWYGQPGAGSVVAR
ncbi:hypothetical protein GCM10020229_33600 [Kitasatospora albolonga]|uniref:bestrophin-like domain n=1 Tax=Kitasatospora albolonga TaxID=68173 RepID=UPI0031ED22F3